MEQKQGPKREYYALDQIEEGIAVLLPFDNSAPVFVPAGQLCGGGPRPADGSLFYRDEAGRWQYDEEETQAQMAAMRAKMQRLMRKKP